ncbi:MAG: mechanosensitive ion channel family protein [Candidatus Omnitrophica bacterium]|nr:mechanosensitive ion channel family protein [Candidatus Omnitrophota bacterium]
MESWVNPEFWRGVVSNTLQWIVETAPSILVILLLTYTALRVLNLFLPRLKAAMIRQSSRGGASSIEEMEKQVQTLLGIVKNLLRVIILGMASLLLLRKFGVDIAPLIAGVGIAGLAIGFGAQELVRDVISGFFILLENQIRVGDVAVINGTSGLVEEISLRTITLRDASGVVHIFQNGKIATLSNMTKGWSAMVFDIGVAYKEDTDRVCDLMKRVAEDLQKDPVFGRKILEPIEIFGVEAFGDSAVVIQARLKTKPSQQWAVGREYRRRLKKAFDAAGIEIPFPHRTLYWGEASKPFEVRAANGVRLES